MKKALLVLTMFAMCGYAANAGDIDPNVRPSSGKVKEVNFPDYEVVTLSNGLKVYVVTNDEQPVVNFRLQVFAGDAYDTKLGTASMAASLLTKGAGERDATSIASTMDGIGANYGASTSGEAFTVSASGLIKHMDIILDVFSDMVLRPTFDQAELEKLKPQMVAGIKSEKGDAGTIAQSMARKVIYGFDHPYAVSATEESVESISVNDLKSYHKNFFKPNNATLAVIGDITADEIKPILEEKLGSWKKGRVVKNDISSGEPSSPDVVYYVERPGSVQSSMILTSHAVPYAHPDYETLDLAARMIGTGFGGRLFRTLRETHSYTYTPFGFLTGARAANRFAAGAQVRNDVTDSSVLVTVQQIQDLVENPPSADELNRIKRSWIGNYLMAFESSSYVGSLLQNTDMYGVDLTRYTQLPDRVDAMTAQQVSNIAKKYMDVSKLALVIVGSPEVLPDLEKFGPIQKYDLDLKPLQDMQEVDMSVSDLIAAHVKGIGGQANIDKLTSVSAEMTVAIQAGPQALTGTGEMYSTIDGKQSLVLSSGGQVIFEDLCDGTNAWESQGPQSVQKQGAELMDARLGAYITPLVHAQDLGYELEIRGMRDGQIMLAQINPEDSSETLLYLNANTFLVEKTEKQQDAGPQGSVTVTQSYSKYTSVGGVMLPTEQETVVGQTNIKTTMTYAANPDVSGVRFSKNGAE